jgi:hypothetical protein
VGLFKAVDVAAVFKIPPYNGGLFATDAALDGLTVSNKLGFTKLAGYDYAQEVSVTVLGRIASKHPATRSALPARALCRNSPLTATNQPRRPAGHRCRTERKRDGVVYTPDHITRFIVRANGIPGHRRALFLRYREAPFMYRWRMAQTNKDERPQPPIGRNRPHHGIRLWLARQTELRQHPRV